MLTVRGGLGWWWIWGLSFLGELKGDNDEHVDIG